MLKKYEIQKNVSIGAAFVVGFLWMIGLLRIVDWMSLLVAYGLIWFVLYITLALSAPSPKKH